MSLHSAYRLGVPMKLANLVVGQAWFDAHQLYLDARDTPPAALLALADLLEWLPGWGTIRWRLSNAWLAAAYAHLETECTELYRVELAAEYQDLIKRRGAEPSDVQTMEERHIREQVRTRERELGTVSTIKSVERAIDRMLSKFGRFLS